jgi:hypothetical protein
LGAAMLDFDKFKTPVVRDTYSYWLSKCDKQAMPRRSDIRPEELRTLLPYIFLVDIGANPTEFRFRLVGSEIGVWAGKEYTGAAINEAEYGPQWRRIHAVYMDVLMSRQPRHDLYHAPWVSREFLYYERLVAPLSSDGQTIDMLFGSLHIVAQADLPKQGG